MREQARALCLVSAALGIFLFVLWLALTATGRTVRLPPELSLALPALLVMPLVMRWLVEQGRLSATAKRALVVALWIVAAATGWWFVAALRLAPTAGLVPRAFLFLCVMALPTWCAIGCFRFARPPRPA